MDCSHVCSAPDCKKCMQLNTGITTGCHCTHLPYRRLSYKSKWFLFTFFKMFLFAFLFIFKMSTDELLEEHGDI